MSALVFALSLLSSVLGEFDTRRLEQLDTYLDKARRETRVPGMAVAVIYHTNVAFLKTYGEGVNPQTPFKLGSITKSFTAAAILQLVEQGKLNLDAPVQTYLPWFRVVDDDASQTMTLKHLLHHRSGFSTLQGRVFASGAAATDVTELARSYRDFQLQGRPGERFRYSNANYNVLGAVIEAVSGLKYSDYIQQHVFNPLGMRHSYTSYQNARAQGLQGHRFWFGHPVPCESDDFSPSWLPSGGLASSVEDMTRYAAAMLQQGSYAGGSLLSSNSVEHLFHRPVGATNDRYYAMAWVIRTRDGALEKIGHGGSTADFLTDFSFSPENKLGLVILMNAVSYKHARLERINSVAYKILLGEALTPPPFDLMGTIISPAFLVFPFLQCLGLLMTLKRLRKWRSSAPPAFTRFRWMVHWVLPLLGHVFVAVFVFLILPSGMDATLGIVYVFAPDLALQIICIGGFALVWGTVRTFLVGKVLLREHPTLTQPALGNDGKPAFG